MTDITKAITAAREALALLREHDGGTRYNGEDDDVGTRACCGATSWKPHDSDCPHAVAVAEFDRLLAALDAAQGEAVVEFMGRRRTPEKTSECWGVMLCDSMQDPPKGTKLYLAPQAPLAAVPAQEPLFLLHTGTIYGNERGDWEVETNSGWGVDVDIYCDANPGRTVGLYLAPPAAVPAGYVPVPVEPTQAMLDAAGMCIIPDGKEWLDQSNREVWASMLAAANKENPDAHR